MRRKAAFVLTILFITSVAGSAQNPKASPSLTYPRIVASGKLVTQTRAIPNTTIFTPVQTGLYRLTVYMTVTQTNYRCSWIYQLNWTDDAGPEKSRLSTGLTYLHQGSVLPVAYAYNDGTNWPGATVPFEAVAGSAVTYSVTADDLPESGAYSLYYTIEQLE